MPTHYFLNNSSGTIALEPAFASLVKETGGQYLDCRDCFPDSSQVYKASLRSKPEESLVIKLGETSPEYQRNNFNLHKL